MPYSQDLEARIEGLKNLLSREAEAFIEGLFKKVPDEYNGLQFADKIRKMFSNIKIEPARSIYYIITPFRESKMGPWARLTKAWVYKSGKLRNTEPVGDCRLQTETSRVDIQNFVDDHFDEVVGDVKVKHYFNARFYDSYFGKSEMFYKRRREIYDASEISFEDALKKIS